MKSLNILLAAIFAMVVFSLTAYSQPPEPPCEMDCPGSPWVLDSINLYSVDPIGCPGCQIKFYYWYRTNACGIWNDIQLGEITVSLSCLSCYTIEEIVSFAKDKMIRDGALPKPDSTDPCETNWRAFNSSCWGEKEENGEIIILPCEPAQCCWQILEVCGIGNDEIDYTVIDSYAPNEEVCLYWPHECTFVCEGAPELQKPPTDGSEKINEANGFKVTAYPNPADTRMNLLFESNKTGKFVLQIYDNAGNEVLRKDIKKDGFETYIQLNLSSFHNGIYRYMITSGGQPGINGSFNVIK